MRIGTWNVNGLRARFVEVGAWALRCQLDVFALQEIRASAAQVPEPLTALPAYWNFWHGGAGGYAGVSLHVSRRISPSQPRFSVPPIGDEPRICEVALGDRTIASVYVPNGGKDYPAKLAFLEGLRAHVTALTERPGGVIVVGDLNVTRSDRDLHPTQRKPRAIGQRKDERAMFESLLEVGLTDVLRARHPDADDLFTWWAPWREEKAKNHGWRIDYALVSPSLAATADLSILKDEGTSDHAPMILELPG